MVRPHIASLLWIGLCGRIGSFEGRIPLRGEPRISITRPLGITISREKVTTP